MGRKSGRAKQTRLAFTPVPSSSPATQEYNKQIRDRAAAVTVQGLNSSSRQSSLQISGNKLSGQDIALPTPVASAEIQLGKDVDDGSEGDNTNEERQPSLTPFKVTDKKKKNNKKRHGQKQQQPLDFTNSRDPASFDPPLRLHSSTHIRSLPHEGVLKTKRSSRRKRERDSSSSSDESNHHSGQRTPTSSRVTRSSQRARAADTNSKSEFEIIASRPISKQLDESQDEEEDDDDMPTALGTQRRKRRENRAPSVDSFISSPPRAAEESDDEVEIIEPPRKRKFGRLPDEDSRLPHFEDDEEQEPTTPRRRLKRRRRLDSQEAEDLAEDLEFLHPSSDNDFARRPSTQSANKIAKQKALEKLKRMRSSQTQTQSSAPPAVQDDLRSGSGDKDDGEDYKNDEYKDDYTGNESDEQDDAPPVSSRQIFAPREDDEDFVEEDDDLGVRMDVPLEFTRYASMKAKDLFKFAVDWMVQKKINPAFSMSDEIYELTFRKLSDEVTALTGSKFVSAVWTPEFTTALKARPEIAIEALNRLEPEHFMRDHCDACNRSGHPATYQIQFRGTPYHPETLEEVDNPNNDNSSSSSDEGDERDDRPSYTHDGREVVPVNKVFYVGRFCLANAQTAHLLSHWRHRLYDTVQGYLISRGHLTSAKIVERDGWTTRKRRKYANKIVDRMEREMVMRDIWRTFKEEIDMARNAKQAGRG